LFLPVWNNDAGQLVVWVTQYTDPYVFDQYRMSAAQPVVPVLVTKEQLLDALQRVHQEDNTTVDQILEDLPPSILATQLAEKPDLLEADDEAPIIGLVNSLIVQALRHRASDIHIEPFEDRIIVRFRVDGHLHEALRPPKPVQAPFMSRIKIMAGLNIAERRLPQDGSMRVQFANRDVDVRVSVLPSNYGERLVMRLLEKQKERTNLTDLGLTDDQLAWMQARSMANHGILLVTGPTGSGKSTTLYALLSSINTSEKNIITIEDPIEYSLAGVGQIQVAPKIGLTFAAGLRSILRQDPDVIMVGEIRDQETAEIAIQASLTGHLVLSTLHTIDSVGAVVRLVNMGIEPFLVSSSINGVVAQRLVRKLCLQCKEPFDPLPELLLKEGIPLPLSAQARFFRPRGCKACMGTGYLERTAVFELLTMSNTIKTLIDRRASDQELRQRAFVEKMTSLRMAAFEKASVGITSLEEVFRVTREYSEAI